MQVEYLQAVVLFLLACWILAATFHSYFIPALDTSSRDHILDFIISKKGLKIKPELALPDIYILSIQDVAGANLITMPILEASGMPDFYVERYHKTWNRILIAEGCRQNILVHSLVHYVQFEYEPALMSLKEKEKEAWDITKQYLKHYYPWRYWALTIPYGFYNWWTSAPY